MDINTLPSRVSFFKGIQQGLDIFFAVQGLSRRFLEEKKKST